MSKLFFKDLKKHFTQNHPLPDYFALDSRMQNKLAELLGYSTLYLPFPESFHRKCYGQIIKVIHVN